MSILTFVSCLTSLYLFLARLIGSVSLQERMKGRELTEVEDGVYLPIYSRDSRGNEPFFTCRPYRSFLSVVHLASHYWATALKGRLIDESGFDVNRSHHNDADDCNDTFFIKKIPRAPRILPGNRSRLKSRLARMMRLKKVGRYSDARLLIHSSLSQENGLIIGHSEITVTDKVV